MTAPGRPGDRDDDADAPRPLLGPVFWALLLATAVCIGAGGVIGWDGARLFPSRQAPSPAAEAPRPPPSPGLASRPR